MNTRVNLYTAIKAWELLNVSNLVKWSRPVSCRWKANFRSSVCCRHYRSSKKKATTVSTSGRIKAKAKGSCKRYVYAANGVSKTFIISICVTYNPITITDDWIIRDNLCLRKHFPQFLEYGKVMFCIPYLADYVKRDKEMESAVEVARERRVWMKHLSRADPHKKDDPSRERSSFLWS